MSTEPAPVLSYQADTSTVSRWDVAFLGCRFFAVYCVIQLAVSLPYAWAYVRQFDGQWMPMLVMGLGFAASGAAAIILWTQAGRLARWMLSDAAAAGASGGPATASFQAIGISLIGLFVAAIAMPRVAASVVEYTLYGVVTSVRTSVDVLMSITGVCLFLGAKGLSRLWYRLRTAGIHHSDNAPVTPEPPNMPR